MERLIFLNTTADTQQLKSFTDGISITSVATAQSGQKIRDIVGDSESVFFADRRLVQTGCNVRDLLEGEADASAVLFQIEYPTDNAIINSLTPDGIVAAITHPGNTPAMLIKLPTSFLISLDDSVLEDGRETILQLLISAISQGISIEMSSVSIQATDSSELSCDLDGATRSRLLSYAVGSINIEELFPNHAWDAYEEESAAACFHTLAAHFIRYGDLQAAEECLSFSERLEESPRALALRALISKQNGETLGAVANMVSSLQGYESRKRSDADTQNHYITFAPTDLEVINDSLHNGLSALNKQDNDTAFSHFAKAVYSFDSFFNKTGLQSFKQ